MSDLPTIRIQGDQELGRQYIPVARDRLRRLRELLSHRGIEVGGDHGPLADGVYYYARIAGGVSVIQIVADSSKRQLQELAELIEVKYPDFLSGVILNGHIDSGLLYSFRPTAQCTILHGLPSALQPVARLAVKPLPEYALELSNGSGSAVEFSQYTKLKAGWYSGTMRKLVQFLMGYGKQPKESIYKPRKEIPEPEDYFTPPPTQFQKDVKSRGLQIRYDWRFSRTHGLVRATDGKWWLVEIAEGAGVHAMPLALYKATTTDEFRDYLSDIGDDDALEVIDLFGGFPTGECIPQTDDLRSCYIRAGIVLKLADSEAIAPFYEHEAYTSACGWAFSQSGRRAVNTAYRYADDTVQRGVMYEISTSIGDARQIEPADAALRLKQYISKRAEDLGEKLHPLLIKCDLLTDDQIADLMRLPSDEAAAQLDEIEVDSLAEGSSTVANIGEGKLLWRGETGPALKFHDPLLGELVSHDFNPLEPGPPEGFDRRCNTTVYAFFYGETLRKCNFYFLPAEGRTTFEEFGEQECRFVGEWGTRVSSNSNGVFPLFYTTEIDNREVFPDSLMESRSEGVDIGFTSCQYGDNPSRLWESFMFRTKSFRITTTVQGWASKGKGACIAVPDGDREAYYYFQRELVTGKYRSVQVSYTQLADPNSYLGGRKFIIDGTPADCGSSTFRLVGSHVYNGGACSDLADEGEWAGQCQQMEPLAYSVPLFTPPGIIEETDAVADVTGDIVCSLSAQPIRCYSRTVTGDDAPYAGDFLFAKTPDAGVSQVVLVRINCFGEDAAIYAPIINSPMSLSYGPIEIDLLEKNITFIGVYK